MEVEKRSSKGGFLQLFDWNAKPRKKLFSANSEIPEGSKQRKENFVKSSASQFKQMKVHEDGPSPSLRVSSHYNCPSSMSSDEGYGTRAPGVVAKLMGLDSLPTSDFSEARYAPSDNYHSLRGSLARNGTIDIESKCQCIDYGEMRYKLDDSSRNSLELGLPNVLHRPIARFQTEVLPPKSARSIPITHHSLLSPIRSPRYIPTRDVDYIMEAAAKIIKQSPQQIPKTKLQFPKPSLVPLRIRDLKERMEAAQKVSMLREASQRSKDSSFPKSVQREYHKRDQGGPDCGVLLKDSLASRIGGSESFGSKGKSVSRTNQTKANSQRKEGSTASVSGSFAKQKVDVDMKSDLVNQKQQKQKNLQKRTSRDRNLDVLAVNNQKQNSKSKMDRMSSRKPVTDQQGKKDRTSKHSFRLTKTVDKSGETSLIGNRKTTSTAAITGNDLLASDMKMSSGKKPCINVNAFIDEKLENTVLVRKTDRPVKCNPEIDECRNFDVVDRDSGTNVVSFTFTSPIKKSVAESNVPNHVIEKSDNLCFNDQSNSNNPSLSSLGLNSTSGDALNLLLEQKLRELSCALEKTDHCQVNKGLTTSSLSCLQASLSTSSVLDTICLENDQNSQIGLLKGNVNAQYGLECSLADGVMPKEENKWQELEGSEPDSSFRSGECIKLGDQSPSLMSSLEPSFSGESCISSDCMTSFSSSGARLRVSPDSDKVVTWIPVKEREPADDEVELADSACSLFSGTDLATELDFTKSEHPCDWILEYIKCILNSGQLMIIAFTLGEVSSVASPSLFNELENRIARSDTNRDEKCKLWRKVLFDYVNEFIEFRCKWSFSGASKEWVKGTIIFEELLVDEVFGEMSNLRSMEDLMVDEIVDKDMSSRHGKWVDFQIERSEEGIEIHEGILTSLVEELVADLLNF